MPDIGLVQRLRGGGCRDSKPVTNDEASAPAASPIQDLDSPQSPELETAAPESSHDKRGEAVDEMGPAPDALSTSLSRYNDIDAIEAFAAEGDVKFVRASYFLELAEQGGRFPRRQEVPPRALVGRAAFKRMADEVRAWRKILAEYADTMYAADLAHAMRFPPFVVVSYAWLSKEHPDADGRQLREVLAKAIEWYMSERAKLIKGSYYEQFIGAAARLDAPFTAEGVDFAIFVDYCGLWQNERTEEQQASFGRGLAGMDLLYVRMLPTHTLLCPPCHLSPPLPTRVRRARRQAHKEVPVWRMTRLLDGYPGVPAYNLRGWPFFETAASHYIKCVRFVLDLGSEEAVEALAAFEGRRRTPEELAEMGDYEKLFETGRLGRLQDKARPPPLAPLEFAERVAPLKLTNGKDKDVLIKLQAKVATTVLGGVEELQYTEMEWGEAEARVLAQALALCKSLRTLHLDGAMLGDAGVAAVVSALTLCGPLATLGLGATGAGVLAAKALASALSEGMAALTSLELYENDLGAEGGKALAEALKVNKGLRWLDVDNFLGEETEELLREAVKEREYTLSVNGRVYTRL